MAQAPAFHDPQTVASALWQDQGAPTFVVAIDPQHKPLADALASAGGTTQAIEAAPQALLDPLIEFLEAIKSLIDPPICTPGFPRVMVLLDASSSMLNEGDQRAAPGEGGWDQLRLGLAGADGVLDIVLANNWPVEDMFHFGMAVFGSADDEKLVVQYGPCRAKNLAWALDPATSCEAPGCLDPYADAPISWTFKDGSQISPPGFGVPTLSHMPSCEQSGMSPACAGSDNATHLGLQLVRDNIDVYRAACLAPQAKFPCSAATSFLNVLITDGAYDSTDAQIQAPLVAMHAAGVVTHVIGHGDAPDLPQLEKMAQWGSGGLLQPTVVQTQDQLEAAFQSFLVLPVFDPCCTFQSCDTIIDTFGPESDADSFESESDTNTTGGNDTNTTGGNDTGTTGENDTGTTVPVDPDTDDTGVLTSNTAASVTDTSSNTNTITTGDPTAEPDVTGDPTVDPPTTTASDPTTQTTASPTGDASSTGDTEDPSETANDKGCGCTSTDDLNPTSSLLLLSLLALRRRRSPRHPMPAR